MRILAIGLAVGLAVALLPQVSVTAEAAEKVKARKSSKTADSAAQDLRSMGVKVDKNQKSKGLKKSP